MIDKRDDNVTLISQGGEPNSVFPPWEFAGLALDGVDLVFIERRRWRGDF